MDYKTLYLGSFADKMQPVGSVERTRYQLQQLFLSEEKSRKAREEWQRRVDELYREAKRRDMTNLIRQSIWAEEAFKGGKVSEQDFLCDRRRADLFKSLVQLYLIVPDRRYGPDVYRWNLPPQEEKNA